MKNEKIYKVAQAVVQVCNLATVIAQAVMAAFPVQQNLISGKEKFSQEDVKLIKEFLASEEVK